MYTGNLIDSIFAVVEAADLKAIATPQPTNDSEFQRRFGNVIQISLKPLTVAEVISSVRKVR